MRLDKAIQVHGDLASRQTNDLMRNKIPTAEQRNAGGGLDFHG